MAKTATVGRLSVEMVADTVSYVNKMKDAEAKTKASQKKIRAELKSTGTSSKKSAKNVSKMDKAIDDLGATASLITGPLGGVASRISNMGTLLSSGGALVLGIGVATAALVGMVAAGTQIAEVEKQMGRLAKQSKLSTADFLAYAAAYETVDVTGEQLADQTKDLQDRLGEYGTLASGPFKDFVEIMGLTEKQGKDLARSLTQLSGPEVFQELYNQMDAAGKSGAEMTFVLESLGNDASKLIPILEDNGKASAELREHFRLTNTTMEQGTVKAFAKLSKESGSLWRNLQIVSGEAVSPLIDELNDLADAANRALVASSFSSEITSKIDLLPKESLARVERAGELANELVLQNMKLNNGIRRVNESKDRGNHLSSEDVQFRIKAGEKIEENIKLIAAYTAESKRAQKSIADKSEMDHQAKMHEIDAEMTLFFDAEVKKTKKLEKEESKRVKLKIKSDKAIVAAELKAAKAKASEEKKIRAFDTGILAQADAEHKELTAREKTHQEQLRELRLETAEIESTEALDRLLTDAEKAREQTTINQALEHEQLKYFYQQNNLANKDYLEAKSALEKKHAVADAAAKKAANDPSDLAAGLAGLLGQSQTYALSQLAISQAMAIGKAYEMGPIAGATATVGLISTFASLYSSIKGGGDSGQFHSGTDNVASEGSYLLSKGERVVQPKANKDLTSFLNNGESGGTKIDSSLVIQGNVTDEKWFALQLKKQSNQIAGIVSTQQRKYPTRK